MVNTTTAALLLVLTAAACGSAVEGEPTGNGASTEEQRPTARSLLTGVLAGNAAGVHYRTQQLEGLTDGAGSFNYYPGETVSFHLGGVTLGAAVAAPRVELFELAGGALPQNEQALVQAVLDEATVTAFDRAANAALVLLTFDEDDDPSNGVDLADSDLALTGKTLTLDRDMADFPALLAVYAQRAAVPWNAVGTPTALAYLYDSASTRVPAHARRTTFESHRFYDAVDETTLTATYDELGGLTASELLVSGPSPTTSTIVYASDSRGREVRREIVTTDANAVPTATRIMDTRRDGHGQPVWATDSYFQGAMLRYSRMDELEVDTAGRIVAYALRSDLDGDTLPDERGSGAYVYTPTTVRYDTTFNSPVTVPFQTRVTMDFDALGLVVGKRETTDYAIDGTVDVEYAGEYRRDGRGVLTSARETRRAGPDAAPTTATLSYTRDTDGRVVRIETTYEGSPRRVVQQYYFDADHRGAGELTLRDEDGDGVADSSERIDIERDGDGNITARDSRSTVLVNGVEKLVRHVAFSQVVAGGAVQQRLERSDLDGDGVFESETSVRYAYALIPNGVRYIATNAKEWIE